MATDRLVLSLFPGIGMLDRGFEEEGYCVVRGPDVIWGGDIREFRPPAGVFEGVIGGPPCQAFSPLANISGHSENLIPEFERCVAEAQPSWFLMENVRAAPIPRVEGYVIQDRLLNNRWLGEQQNRVRRFSFGTRDGAELHVAGCALESIEWSTCVTSAHGGERKTHFNRRTGGRIQRYSLEQACELQGYPRDFLARSPFKRAEALRAIASGVPLPMARAVARAVKYAMERSSGGTGEP